MTWFKVDDNLATHPKARKAGLQAMGLWVVAGAYCGQHLTDGFVPRWYVGTWPNGPRLAVKLVSAGLWTEATQGGDIGWRFHQWAERQPTKADVEAERERNRVRQAAWREAHRNGVTDGVTDGVSNSAPSRPVPSRPVTSPVAGLSKSSAVQVGSVQNDDLDKIAKATGGDSAWAARVRADILGRATTAVLNESAYVLRAIGDEPERYQATHTPPPYRQLKAQGLA